jgi:zinc transport system substrate-binding protein
MALIDRGRVVRRMMIRGRMIQKMMIRRMMAMAGRGLLLKGTPVKRTMVKRAVWKGTILISGLLVLLASMFAGGCRSVATEQALQQESVVIAASFYPMYIMTRNIAGDIPGVRVVSLTEPVTGCLHDYQLTAADLKNLEGASFLVINGAGMESFMDKITAQRPDLKVVEASRGIELISDDGGEENPHVWVSVSLAMQQVSNISEQLAVLDPGRADAYRSNAAAYLARLQALKDRMHQGLDRIGQRDIITFHEAFPYFAEEFGLNIAAVVEREPGSEPSAGELADTVEVVRQSGIGAIFAEPQYPAKAAETIARETGARVYTLDPAAVGPDDPDAYIGIMDQNLAVLREALGGRS